ncbi:MAG TPA: amidohydrolase family protein [Thermomicrobiales bacterium]|nr:amidohydrolase family protein [Thermomicrobiales bacterium]
MIDLSGLPVVDIHCHPFLNRGPLPADEFTNLASFGGGSVAYMEQGGIEVDDAVLAELQRVKRDTVYFRRLVRDLAAFFGTEPTLDAVLVARNRAVSDDYRGYVQRLYADVGLETLVFDFGYPVPNLPVEPVRAELPVEVVPILRIEPLIVDLLAADIGWAEFKRRYDDTIAEALSTGGYRGLKSIIAYRTGLDVSPLSRSPDQGMQALDAIRRGLGGGSMKKLRDHLLCRALELAMEHDVPMQIHTGMGDFEVNLPLARPSLLLDLLRFPTFRACRVILVHTGYPWHREAGYIANVLPRVYCDVSEGIPFAGHAARSIISEVLEMAPLSKVVYGSDGFNVPEINYSSAKLGKQALAQVLTGLVDDRMLTESDAQEAGAMILSGTARRLYGLQ